MSVALFAFSCIGPQGPPGYDGEGVNKFTLEFKIQSRDWVKVTDGGGNFTGWYYEVNMPELTRYVYERGIYNTYLWDGQVQIPLPLIIYNETDNALWEKKISCDYAIGSVALYYQENDFQNENTRPETMTFRIQLLS